MGISDQDIEALANTKTETEWNALCDDIKLRYSGYPQDWFAKVLVSGLAETAQANWSK